MNILKKVLNLFFPSFCEICRKPLNNWEVLVCNTCYFKLPFLKKYCKRCGTSVLGGDEVSYCGNCLKENFYFDKVLVGFRYESPISEWILEAKFKENFLLAYYLGKLLKRTLGYKIPFVELVLPLPLSKKRFRERGYNQSYLIACGFLEKRPPFNFLLRIKETKPQTELSYKERLENIKGAFWVLKEKVEGKRVLIIDDVMTSGATLNEASKTLKEAGAKEVYACVVARA